MCGLCLVELQRLLFRIRDDYSVHRPLLCFCMKAGTAKGSHHHSMNYHVMELLVELGVLNKACLHDSLQISLRQGDKAINYRHAIS